MTRTEFVQMHVQTTLHEKPAPGNMVLHGISGEDVVTLDQRDSPSVATATVTVTSVGDQRAHEVREIDLAPSARRGHYPTLCGQTITAASMAEPPRRACPRCAELCDSGPAPRPVGLLRRLVGF
jgi:hypothetical protein